MILPRDKEIFDAMLGKELSAAAKREYEKRLQFFHLAGKQGALGIENIVNVLRHVGEDPRAAVPTSVKVNWREVEDGTPVKHRKDGRNGLYCGSIGAGGLLVRWDGTKDLDEVQARFLELGATEAVEVPEAIDTAVEPGETEFPLENPDWKKIKKDDELFVRHEGEMHLAKLKTKLPSSGECTVDIDGSETVIDRDKVFLPVS